MFDKNYIINQIQNKLINTKIYSYDLPPQFGNIHLNNAAVLVPLIFKNKNIHIIFTERTELVATHKGQISFPGGKVEKNESFEQTALRETFEETGIMSENIKIIGRLSSYPTPSGFRIHPFVGYVNKFKPLLSKNEVSKIYIIPFAHLSQSKNMEIKMWYSYGVYHPLPFFYYKKCTIWGATGLILKELIETIGDILLKSTNN